MVERDPAPQFFIPVDGVVAPGESASRLPAARSGAPLVSVVVGTRNSAKFLRRSLDSIAKQTYRPIEIIVVDNFSTDSTLDIARAFTDRVYTLGPERCTQYNFGFRAAKGEWIYRADSDYVLEPALIEKAVEEARRGYDAVLVQDTVDSSVSFWARVRALEQLCYSDDNVNVAARFFRASVVRSLGGYDIALMAGEDYDLHNRLLKAGYRVGRIKAVQTHLDEPGTLREIYDKHRYYGATLQAFLASNPERGMRQLQPIRPAYIRHWRSFLRHPDLAAGFLLYSCVKYAGAWRGWSVTRRQGRSLGLASRNQPPAGKG